MAKKVKKEEEKDVEETKTETESKQSAEVKAPEHEEKEPKSEKEVEVGTPDVPVKANGKYQYVRVKGGFRVYGPEGQIVSPVLENEAKAGDMVLRFNVGK